MQPKRPGLAKVKAGFCRINFTDLARFYLSAMQLLRIFFQLFWIGICAVAMLLQTRLLLCDTLPSGWFTGFVFGATVFGYNFSATRRRRLPAWVLGIAGAFCFLNLPFSQQLIALGPVVAWLLYYDIRNSGANGLRRYPALKPLTIAITWAWVTVLLPLPFPQWTGVAVLFVGRAAFIFALALAFDCCDLAYDRRQGLVTLVMQLGVRGSARLIDAALLLSAACCTLNFILNRYSVPVTLALLLSLCLSRQIIHAVTTQTAWGEWRRVCVDGLMVMQLAIVWISFQV